MTYTVVKAVCQHCQRVTIVPSEAIKAAQPPAAEQMTLADYAARLFDLHGFMLLETYRDKPAVTVTFPDLKEAQQFHSALVELSTHRTRTRSATESIKP